VRATQTRSPVAGCGALAEIRPAIRFLRELAGIIIYRTGALSLYHRLRNRQTLTAIVFHRVLRRDDPRWETSLPPWTVADDTFDECLAFFKPHYTIVTLDDVRASLDGTRPLSPRSLLITFDDGFADNIDYALPLLQKHCASATVFITSDVIGREERLWTEDLLSAFAAGWVGQRELACLHKLLIGGSTCDPEDPTLIWDIVRHEPDRDEALVQTAFSKLKIHLRRIKHPRQMLTEDEIGNLVNKGLSIGAHGKTHTALPFSSNIEAELVWPRTVLNEIVAAHGHGSIDALSFPHGAYTSEIVDQALAAGYKLVFTSDAEICALKNGFLVSPLMGRLDIDGRRIASSGGFRPELLAISLFTAARRPARTASRHDLNGEGRPVGPAPPVPVRDDAFIRSRLRKGWRTMRPRAPQRSEEPSTRSSQWSTG
jgi:peptidoglycan/xylan/chitin deacetylase (PgdA/CDA1 family)